MNANRKDKDGERELAEFVRHHGWPECHRGQQHKGGTDSPDVTDGPNGFHIGCKRTERGTTQVYGWLAQAIEDGGDKFPIVAHRANCREWIGVMRLTDLLVLVRALEQLIEERGASTSPDII